MGRHNKNHNEIQRHNYTLLHLQLLHNAYSLNGKYLVYSDTPTIVA